MILKGIIIVTGCALSLNSIAAIREPIGPDLFLHIPLPWLVIGSLGYTHYQNISACDGQTAFGRFAIAKELFSTGHLYFGLELGLQSGNTMRLEVSQATLDELGGVPIQSTIKPMLDLLATIKIPPTGGPVFPQLKGGLAFRQWQFEGRNSISNLSKITGEIQAGIGYAIGPLASLSLLYQGIYGGNPKFTVSEVSPSGQVSRLPSQQGVLLSFSLNY